MDNGIKIGLLISIIWVLWMTFSYSMQLGLITIFILITLQLLITFIDKNSQRKIKPLKDFERLILNNNIINITNKIHLYLFIGFSLIIVILTIFSKLPPMALILIPFFWLTHYSMVKSGSNKYQNDESLTKEISFYKNPNRFVLNNQTIKLSDITYANFEIFEEPEDLRFFLFSRYNHRNNLFVEITFHTNSNAITFKTSIIYSIVRIKEILELNNIKINHIGHCETPSSKKILKWGEPFLKTQITNLAEEKEPPYQEEKFGEIVSEDEHIYILCPNCKMKYGAFLNEDSEIQIRNFEDEDINQSGQQIHCINCGELFSVPSTKKY